MFKNNFSIAPFFMKKFDYSLDFANLNFRDRPELYCVGRGEQGVLMVEPYKSEILPLDIDPIKAKSAEIFKVKWHEAKNNSKYQQLLKLHKQQYKAKNSGTKAN